MAKVTINRDLLQLIAKLKNAGVTELKMAEHLMLLLDQKEREKRGEPKFEARSVTEKPSRSEYLKYTANEWDSLRPLLRIDFWLEADLFYYLLGTKKQGAGANFKVIDLRIKNREVVSGKPYSNTMEEHDMISKLWKGTNHGTRGPTFKHTGVPIDYAIEWASKVGIYIPWLYWAKNEKLLSFLDEPKFKMKDKRPRTPFYKLLKRELQQAHDECRERPQAKDLIAKWYKEQPEEITEWIDSTHFTYTEDDEEKTMNVDNVRSAINKYTELLK